MRASLSVALFVAASAALAAPASAACIGTGSFQSCVDNSGNSWTMTDQQFGGMRSITGTNSRGRSFGYTCGAWGCN